MKLSHCHSVEYAQIVEALTAELNTYTAPMKQTLETLEEINKLSVGDNAVCLPAEIDSSMDALRQALADAALDKMAENERELGIQIQHLPADDTEGGEA